jgi:insertion element IS1 protein InsB
VAWVLGHRDTAAFKRLYSKVEHLKNCVFYTDDWMFFRKCCQKGSVRHWFMLLGCDRRFSR